MRFLVLMHPNRQRYEAGEMPSPALVEAMMKFNEELAKSGALLALDGLQPPAKGARVRFNGGKASVTDGPFAEAKEVIGGYWILQVKSKEEAVEWVSRCPAEDGDMIELRQIFEMSDFGPEIEAQEAERVESIGQHLEQNRA